MTVTRWTALLPLALLACADRVAPPDDIADDARLGVVAGPTLSFDALQSGLSTTLYVDGAEPFEDVAFAAGRNAGAGPCPSVLGGLCLGIAGPHLLGFAQTDASGHAQLAWTVPANVSGQSLSLQAAMPRGPGGADSVVTAVVQAVVDGTDGDGDGYDASVDCDDGDATVHPGAVELCDGLDNDCDPDTGEDGIVSTGDVNHATVADAAWAAAPGETVTVCAGTYLESVYIDHGVRLIGIGGVAQTVIDASNTGGPALDLEGGTYEIEGITITGGTPGILVHSDVDLTVRHAVITGNTSDSSDFGGGIRDDSYGSRSPSLVLEDVEISSNHAANGGGGLYKASGGALAMTGVVFRDNTAMYGAGARIGILQASITDSTFHDNVASVSGGGLYLYNTELEVTDSDFGVGATENFPDDVLAYILPNHTWAYTWFGAGETFTCTGGICQ